jgi:diphthine methyl ester synthase
MFLFVEDFSVFILYNLVFTCRGNKVYEPPRFMTVNTAISQLLEVLEMRGEPGRFSKTVFLFIDHWSYCLVCSLFFFFTEPAYDEDSLCIGLARLGSDDEKIVAGPMRKLVDVDFGAPPHCLVIVGETTTVEEEMLEFYMIRS